MKPPIDYAGAWVLVTGASSGIGEEFARKLAERGANLLLTARSGERLERLGDDLRRVNGIDVRTIPADLSAPNGPRDLLAEIAATGVFVEHLVNNAGFGSTGPFASLDSTREVEMVRLNCEAVVALTRALVEPMLVAGRGGIINVASTASFQPVPFMATYGATKAFVSSFSLALARELHRTNVRVMALCPGPVRTGFQKVAGISRPGNPLAELTARQTVERGLAAYERGQALYVPGVVNGAQTLAVKLLPRGLLGWAAARAMHHLGRAG
jgi:short-subunit dehydrogenase